jgi:hypothetical protein
MWRKGQYKMSNNSILWGLWPMRNRLLAAMLMMNLEEGEGIVVEFWSYMGRSQFFEIGKTKAIFFIKAISCGNSSRKYLLPLATCRWLWQHQTKKQINGHFARGRQYPPAIGQRGVNTVKCECVNKMTTIRARRMFIS